jgi:amino acid adenylation domain-containing protein
MKLENVEDVYPLSPGQQGMLFESIAFAGADADPYVFQHCFSLPADLDPEALRPAWEALLSTHPTLRTAFLWEGLDRPLQVVRKRVTARWEVYEWAGNETEAQERLAQLRLAQRRAGFGLSQAPLVRLTWIRWPDASWRVVLSCHHLVADGWSLSLLLADLWTLASGGSAPARRPYRDFIGWLQTRDLREVELFWRKRLEGFSAPTPLPLPAPDASPDACAERWGEHGTTLSDEESAALHACARTHHVTPSALVLATWALLISRYAGERDVLFGVVVSGRSADLPGIDEMVGNFVNVLPLRVRMPEAGRSTPDWLRSIQAELAELQAYEFISLIDAKRWSEIPPSAPLLESAVACQNFPFDRELTQKLGLRGVESVDQMTVPLSLEAETDRPVQLRLTYDRERFDSRAVARALVHLRRILATLTTRPEVRPDAVDLLDVDERRTRAECVELGDGGAPIAPQEDFARLFLVQADRTPDAPAVVFGEASLSYAELAGRAAGMAQQLAELGVGPEVLVGIEMKRSADMLVALLGTLLAGGAFVPLDSAWPGERMSYVLENAGIRVIVGDRAPDPAREGIVHLEAAGQALAQAAPSPEVGPASLAYLIYTSGSTGVPKAALLQRDGMLNHLLAKVDALGLTGHDVVAQTASHTFDVSIWQFLAPLLVGGRVHVVDGETVRDAQALVAELERAGVTVFETVPALLQELLPTLGGGEDRPVLAALRWLLVTGEAVPVELTRAWLGLRPEVPLVNAYGPTECSDDVTHAVVDEQPAEGEVRVPIGRPIPGIRTYIVDASGTPVPLGTPGELWIGGIGVGRGYLNDPERTERAFLSAPAQLGPDGARLYRSGDRARWRRDGSIEFLGRSDHQVKVRGFRVELGEIESNLNSAPDVQSCAVVALDRRSGGRQLAAYVVGDSEGAVPGETLPRERVLVLRSHLRRTLPEYMVPAVFVAMDALPRTSTGKIDRNALPAPRWTRSDDEFVRPRTETERALAAIWAQLFELETVGIHDDFFELGGHSLVALSLVGWVRSELGVSLPVRSVFEAGTLAELAAHIDREAGAAADEHPDRSGVVAARAERRPPRAGLDEATRRQQGLCGPEIEDVHELSPAQLGMLAGCLASDDPERYATAAVLRLCGALDPGAVERAVGIIVRRHPALRSQFAWEGLPHPVQVVRTDVDPRVAWLDERGESEGGRAAVEKELAAMRCGGFDLEHAPLMRVSMIRTQDDEWSLVWVNHHLVADGWSWSALFPELLLVYAALSQGSDPVLPAVRPYRDFVDWVAARDPAEAERHWETVLGGFAEPTLNALPRVASGTGAGSETRHRSATLSAKTTAALNEMTQRSRLTPSVVAHAAWALALHRATGRRDLVYGSTVAGRPAELEGAEGIVGNFANVLPLRLRVDDSAQALGWMKDLHGQQLDGMEHSWMSLAQLGRLAAIPDGALLTESAMVFTPTSHLEHVVVRFQEETTQPARTHFGDLELAELWAPEGKTQFPLFLEVLSGERFVVRLSFHSDRFGEPLAESLLTSVCAALGALAQGPERRLGELLQDMADSP